jgi:hypothetical protein
VLYHWTTYPALDVVFFNAAYITYHTYHEVGPVNNPTGKRKKLRASSQLVTAWQGLKPSCLTPSRRDSIPEGFSVCAGLQFPMWLGVFPSPLGCLRGSWEAYMRLQNQFLSSLALN